MPYSPTTWVDGTTPLNATNMNHIELGIAAAAGIGSTALVYRYTVVGSDKASIDTGVDTADAGSNDWTNGDLLEVQLYVRTDEAVGASLVDLVFNNDTGANYGRIGSIVSGSSVSVSWITGQNNLVLSYLPGASAGANIFGTCVLTCPNFSGTVGYKGGSLVSQYVDASAATSFLWPNSFTYTSTSAITRIKVLPDTAGKKLKVGSQLLIYKRLAS